jgi:outer membrane protein assembly factor BamB
LDFHIADSQSIFGLRAAGELRLYNHLSNQPQAKLGVKFMRRIQKRDVPEYSFFIRASTIHAIFYEAMKINTKWSPINGAAIFSLACFGAGLACQASDWPQFRGPNHDAVSTEKIMKVWPETGPKQVWKKSVTNGFSSFTIANGRAFTLIKRSISGVSKEVLIALNADTGVELWAQPIENAKYTAGGDTAGGGDGPRSTPTVDGNNVYTLSSYLLLACFDAATGEKRWEKDIKTLYGGKVIDWQNAASPLIEGNLLFLNGSGTGQCLLALNKSDGSLAWKKLSDKNTHATPVAATILGTRQIVFFTQSGLVSVNPETGEELWRQSFPFSTSSGASPVVAGDIVYCSAGYGVGAGAFRISKINGKFSVKTLWRLPGQFMNHWSTPVFYNGYLFGLFGHTLYESAPLQCIALETGDLQWSIDGFGQGGIMIADGKLLVMCENGDLVLAEPDPTNYIELARYSAVTGKSWNGPSISNGRIYARSISEAVCLDVSAAKPFVPLVSDSFRCAPDGKFELLLKNNDGSEVTPDQLSQVRVYSSVELSIDAAQWAVWDSIMDATNGMLRVKDAQAGQTAQRFYQVRQTDSNAP